MIKNDNSEKTALVVTETVIFLLSVIIIAPIFTETNEGPLLKSLTFCHKGII